MAWTGNWQNDGWGTGSSQELQQQMQYLQNMQGMMQNMQEQIQTKIGHQQQPQHLQVSDLTSQLTTFNKVHVEDLPSGVTEMLLKVLFSQYGTVNSCEYMSGSKGHKPSWIVEMSSPMDAQWLCENINGNIPAGLVTPVKISLAVPKGTVVKNDGKGGDRFSPYGNASVSAVLPASQFAHQAAKNKIFVGGLPQGLSDADVARYFSAWGNVQKCTIHIDPQTGASKGFCFVTFDSSAAAEKVMAYDSHEIGGKWVEVSHASADGKRVDGQRGSTDQAMMRKLFVAGMPYDINEDAVSEYFSHYGEVKDCRLQRFDNGDLRGFGFVNFVSKESVDKVLAAGTLYWGDRKLEIDRAKPMTDPAENDRGDGGKGPGRPYRSRVQGVDPEKLKELPAAFARRL